jgi:hypothetical protein
VKIVNSKSFLRLLLSSSLVIIIGCGSNDNGEQHPVTATIIDINGFLVPEATVEIMGAGLYTTDSRGRFEVNLSDDTYPINVLINNSECYSGELAYADKSLTTIDIYTSCSLWSEITPKYVIVDDYEGESTSFMDWYYTRIGTDRGEMSYGSTQVDIGGGSASVSVSNGWAGIWSSLLHNASSNDDLDPTNILGPYINSQYQPSITGIEIALSDGTGTFKIELKGVNNNLLASKEFSLTGGERNLLFTVTPDNDVHMLNWLIEGSGNATVEQVRLLLQSPTYITPEAVFLFTYSHLSQCYDATTGWVRDRAKWPSEDYSSVQTIATFALATAIAQDFGYVDHETAKEIINKTKNAILAIPTYNGLLPHFITNGQITAETEWSSVDTAITLISEILACQALGIDASQLEAMVRNIDWDTLTGNQSHPISHGYDYSGNLLSSQWDTFGSESFIVAVAYSSGTGRNDVLLGNNSAPPTWDGSGFNDELASVFFPMDMEEDKWGNIWSDYRRQASEKQVDYFSKHRYSEYGLFGLSASEVPDPWDFNPSQSYSAWGVGGYNNTDNNGTSIVGYPIIAPHYASLVSNEYPYKFDILFKYLMDNIIFTPLNNVESLGIDDDDMIKWNSLKGSWNLSLQILGAGRTLSKGNYLPYQVLSENSFLYTGYTALQKQIIYESNCSSFGACIYHSGVYCAAGPNSEGYVIRNDGFASSSVVYQCH